MFRIRNVRPVAKLSPMLFFHVNRRPLGRMRYELERTCKLLGIQYGRRKGIVFRDTRHSAVTNLVASGVPEPVAMTITGHTDSSVFRRYNVRRDDVQADALARQASYLARQRGATPQPTPLKAGRPKRAPVLRSGHDRARRLAAT